ncbi:TetR/AcrR family transcriptional regulator [Novosphingobium sp. KCTC 2891]|uniref:TetR/AcrR family transcriptional regulator n=1 Tax=Novosphingobium sp. KCTC 2891 TaxID=2989730 RepID=UPI00222214A5|nr:TetR/AcrR family transcriptional regulator [Novosphingobium sp. KCTC 2891]MCW1382686.1 TetR/AcrR family transcriptional regulator [Novosphingobium sp. KCTC 2891]
MQVNSVEKVLEGPAVGEGDTARLLLKTARKLFAERGIRAVTVREIAREAGQRNQGAVAYHFGTKDALVTRILTDGAERIEARRHAFLAALEAEGGPRTVRDAVAAIIVPSAAFADEDEEHGSYFNRFLARLALYDPAFIDRVLEGRYNAGYQRCLAHLRTLMADLPREAQSRRFAFLGTYVSSLLAQREAALAEGAQERRRWRSDKALDDLIVTAAAILEARG